MELNLRGKRVLVTGSSRGIGLATARAFLAEGARVAVNGRTAESAAGALEALGAGVAAPGDVASVAGCAAVVGAAADALGGLDILVNNAGVYAVTSIAETDEQLWDATLDTSLKGAFFCSRAALPALQDSGGNIVNISSAAGLSGFPGVAAYCAAKAGLVNLTRSMALELAPGVRVNCVCPGPVETDMGRVNYDPKLDAEAGRQAFAEGVPLQRIGAPDEVARSVLWLASEVSAFVTGAVFSIDGGRAAGGQGGAVASARTTLMSKGG